MLEKKTCQFCQDKIDSQGKIYPPRRFGTCTKHQRILTRAIKKSRIMALTPIVIK
ncbi:MAG: 30S ribosomal protein S18 [Candidatus Moranbacteria bacterium GW2011_GWE2_35_164]|nr:MAG: 30S ribosomal protein S18 [Candidatus Moranbacteria bacterium GW2011_GWE2_35_164]